MLESYGATRRELKFLITRKRRVELNAMTAPQFVSWLELQLDMHGAGKVVPAPELIERRAREALASRFLRERVGELEREALAAAAKSTLPDDLGPRVQQLLEQHPDLAWDDAVELALPRAS